MPSAICHYFLPFCLLALLPFTTSCGNRSTGKNTATADTLSVPKEQTKQFPSLEPGVFSISDNAFGEIVELKGTPVATDALFKPSELNMLIRNNMLIMKTGGTTGLIKFLSLPDLKVIREIGTKGGGPGELLFPEIFESAEPGLLCYVYDLQQEKVYQIDTSFVMKETGFNLEKHAKQMFGNKQFVETRSREFCYVSNATTGKAIYQYVPGQQDSLKQIYNVEDGFKKNLGWTALIGDFGGNRSKNRLAYAYKYFHQIRFFDIVTGKTRTLQFEATANNDTESPDATAVLAPTSVTHFWGMSAQPEYVYCAYSGRTPIQVQEEFQKETDHIYIEQYDWNGNPVKKYNLDHWGYFCVDEATRTIYVAAVNAAEPMYAYKY